MTAPETLATETFIYVILGMPEIYGRLHTCQWHCQKSDLNVSSWPSNPERHSLWHRVRDTSRMKEESEGPNGYVFKMALQVTLRKSWKALGILQMTPERKCWKGQVDMMSPAWGWQRSQATVGYLGNALWKLHEETIGGKDSGMFLFKRIGKLWEANWNHVESHIVFLIILHHSYGY